MEKWNYAIETAGRAVFFGHGLGNADKELLNTYRDHNFELGIKHEYNAHNMYLQIFLYSGILGVLCFIMLIYLLLCFNMKSKHKIIMYLFLIIFLFNGGTESLLDRQFGLFTFAFLAPLIYLFIFSSSNDNSEVVVH